jgi:hypothetical protein
MQREINRLFSTKEEADRYASIMRKTGHIVKGPDETG